VSTVTSWDRFSRYSAPHGMIMKLCWNAGKQRQRPWVGRWRLWEAPVQYGGHVPGGMEFSSGGGCVQVRGVGAPRSEPPKRPGVP
jgi:hypothetical protein